MSWSFWIFLAVVAICITALVAQWRHTKLKLAISDERYKEIASQIGLTQRAIGRMGKVLKPVVIKTLGPQKAVEIFGSEDG